MGNSSRNCDGTDATIPAADAFPAPVLIIGYGNTLRRDDGVGVYVAEHLAARRRPGVQILACHQLTPELAEPISRAAAVVFLDAAVGEPRQVRMRRLRPMAAAPFLAHGSSPARLLGLARTLFGRSPSAWLLTIPAEDFGLGEGFSPRAQVGIRTALAQLEAWLRRRLSLRAPKRSGSNARRRLRPG